MRLVLLTITLFVGVWGCPPKPPPVPTPNSADMATLVDLGMAVCSADVLAVNDDSCDGFFTATNLACARCPGGGACYDPTDVVYCAAGGSCFNDPLCFKVKEATSKRKKHR